MKKLYKFHCDFGRMGNLEGVFIANEEDVKKLIGRNVYFGEVLGKHSEVHGYIEEKDLTVKSEDQDFINTLKEIFGNTISGHNPFNYCDIDEEERM